VRGDAPSNLAGAESNHVVDAEAIIGRQIGRFMPIIRASGATAGACGDSSPAAAGRRERARQRATDGRRSSRRGAAVTTVVQLPPSSRAHAAEMSPFQQTLFSS